MAQKIIVIVGAGGIGSNLFQKLARYAPEEFDILLIDGDIVEEKNILRQCFTKVDIGNYKAEALATKANNTLKNRQYSYNKYLSTTEDEGAQTVEDLCIDYNHVVLFGCVDNNPARMQLEKFFKNTSKSVLYIDAANESKTGDVVSCLKRPGELIQGALRSMYDANVSIDKENDPNIPSCGDFLDAGNIQTLIANDKAAIIALEVFDSYLNRELKEGLVVFDSCVTHLS